MRKIKKIDFKSQIPNFITLAGLSFGLSSIRFSIDYNFEVINVGSGKTHSIKSIIKTLQEITNKKIFITNKNLIRKNEIMKTQLDIKKAKKLLKWAPKWSMKKALKYTIKKKRIY